MKKGWKITLIILSSLLIISGIVIPLLPYMLGWKPAYGTPVFEFPFQNPDEIVDMSAYNIPDWGEPGKHHNGIDLIIDSPQEIISPCHGFISRIWYNINPYSGGEVAMIHVSIKVNYAWKVKLVFEPYANTTTLREQQLESIIVKVGTKVAPGDLIGTLLFNYHYPHLHYMIMKNEIDVCPYNYSSPIAQGIFEDIAERTNSTICY